MSRDLTDVTIRLIAVGATTSLVAELCEMINTEYKVGEAGIVVDDEKHPFARVLPEELQTLIKKEQLLVAFEKSCVVGCIKAGVINEHADGDTEEVVGEFGMLTVRKQAQCRGIASLLVHAAEDRLVHVHNCTVTQLELLSPAHWVHPHKERLRSWYTQKLGYSIQHAHDNTKSSGRVKEGTWLLERVLMKCDADFTVYRKRHGNQLANDLCCCW